MKTECYFYDNYNSVDEQNILQNAIVKKIQHHSSLQLPETHFDWYGIDFNSNLECVIK